MGQLRVEMADIAFSYVDPKRFKYLKDLIEKVNKSGEKSLHRIEGEITELLNKEKINFH